MTASPQDQVTGFWSMVAPGYQAHPGNVPAIGTDAYGRWIEMLGTEVSEEPSDVLDLATGNRVRGPDPGAPGPPGDGDRPVGRDAGGGPPDGR
jgi:hypothetical protein